MAKNMTLDEKWKLLEDEQNAGVDLKSGKRPVMTQAQAMGAMAGKPELTDPEVLQVSGAADVPGGVRGARPAVENLWGFDPKAPKAEDGANPPPAPSQQNPVSLAFQLMQSGQAETEEEAIALARKQLGIK